jgi:phosphoacetylglucosamine mutase
MRNIGDGVQFHEISGVDKDKATEWASIEGYNEMLSDAYLKLIKGAPFVRSVVVDASYGVGGTQLPRLIDHLNGKAQGQDPKTLDITLLNNVGEGDLNEGCGAEYVQKGRTPPSGWTPTSLNSNSPFDLAEKRLCSFDGDGDRLVYHYFDANGNEIVLNSFF